MTDYFLVMSTENSEQQYDAPTNAQIIGVMNELSYPGVAWVGPNPRITRDYDEISFKTTVAWLLGITGYTAAQETATVIPAIKTQIQGFLGGISSLTVAHVASNWSDVLVTPWDPVVNGPLDWWQTGQNVIAQTSADGAFPSPALAFFSTGVHLDNPIGPTTAGTALITPSLGGLANSLVDTVVHAGHELEQPVTDITNLLVITAVIAGGGALLYFAWPYLVGIREGQGPLATFRARKPKPAPARKSQSAQTATEKPKPAPARKSQSAQTATENPGRRRVRRAYAIGSGRA